MINRTDIVIRKTDAFSKALRLFLDKEIQIKVEQDENPVPYILKKIEKDFLIVNYGESQRIIPINKILFIQIGSYPKKRIMPKIVDVIEGINVR